MSALSLFVTRCKAEEGEDCEKYAKAYRSMCPTDWVRYPAAASLPLPPLRSLPLHVGPHTSLLVCPSLSSRECAFTLR